MQFLKAHNLARRARAVLAATLVVLVPLGCADDDDAEGGGTSRDCSASPIVGSWAPSAFPAAPVLSFESDCMFAGDATGDCGSGAVTFSNAPAPAGQITLRVNGADCAACEYDVDDASTPRTLEFGCPSIEAAFVEAD